MPRYTKEGGKHGYRKRYKQQDHESNTKVLANLSNREFRTLQEIAKHGMGMYTPFRESLSAHPKKKVKPSAFQQYAFAQTPEDLAEKILQERREHDDHLSETHFGGGLRDAHNAVGAWAFDLASSAYDEAKHLTEWVIDQLDPETSTPHSDTVQQAEEKQEIPNEAWIDKILDEAAQNTTVDNADWIGGILGTTSDFLSQNVARI